MNKFLIVGLGNIGEEYHETRHNIGFIILDMLAQKLNAKFELKKLAFHTTIRYKGKSIECIKPTTYMNLSGKAVRYYLLKQRINISNMLLIVDDIFLPFGTIRFRKKGGAAGHNGLKNIENAINTSEYPRMKWGIGNDFKLGQQTNYVLSPFSHNQKKEIISKSDTIIDSILSFCTQGINITMNSYNK